MPAWWIIFSERCFLVKNCIDRDRSLFENCVESTPEASGLLDNPGRSRWCQRRTVSALCKFKQFHAKAVLRSVSHSDSIWDQSHTQIHFVLIQSQCQIAAKYTMVVILCHSQSHGSKSVIVTKKEIFKFILLLAWKTATHQMHCAAK